MAPLSSSRRLLLALRFAIGSIGPQELSALCCAAPPQKTEPPPSDIGPIGFYFARARFSKLFRSWFSEFRKHYPSRQEDAQALLDISDHPHWPLFGPELIRQTHENLKRRQNIAETSAHLFLSDAWLEAKSGPYPSRAQVWLDCHSLWALSAQDNAASRIISLLGNALDGDLEALRALARAPGMSLRSLDARERGEFIERLRMFFLQCAINLIDEKRWLQKGHGDNELRAICLFLDEFAALPWPMELPFTPEEIAWIGKKLNSPLMRDFPVDLSGLEQGASFQAVFERVARAPWCQVASGASILPVPFHSLFENARAAHEARALNETLAPAKASLGAERV